MKLNLKTPLLFFDIESTGLDIVKDRIVEISMLKVYPDGTEQSKTLRINPEMKMPKEAFAIHGISDKDLENCPTFKEIAKDLAHEFEGCDLAGYNSAHYDLPILVEEFLRAGVDIDFSKAKMIDVQTIFHKMEQRTLSAAYKFYCNADLVAAHTAEADTRATYEVLQAQLDRYDNLQNDVTFLNKFTTNQRRFADFAGRLVYNSDGEEIINFGKYKGQKAEEVLRNDPKYYMWVQEADFPLETKRVFTKIRLRSFNK